MDELSYADISQQYFNNLVSYKGRIVHISRVFEDKRVKLFYLDNRVAEVVQFKLEDFSVIKRRLGMVNVCDAVVYASRNPVRKMGIGLSKDNINISMLPIKYPQGRDDTVYAVRSLVHEGLFQTMSNHYPSFQTALTRVVAERPMTVAFDRQFAVDSDGTIYYKTEPVGSVPKAAKSVAEILFLANKQHLSILLENNHEKTIGYSCS